MWALADLLYILHITPEDGDPDIVVLALDMRCSRLSLLCRCAVFRVFGIIC
jgi:hypothetical protein